VNLWLSRKEIAPLNLLKAGSPVAQIILALAGAAMSTVRQYDLCDVRDEVKALVAKGLIARHHCIYSVCRFFNHRDWLNIEKILEAHDYLLRDSVLDLLGKEIWAND
jgi:hypothetical protein